MDLSYVHMIWCLVHDVAPLLLLTHLLQACLQRMPLKHVNHQQLWHSDGRMMGVEYRVGQQADQ